MNYSKQYKALIAKAQSRLVPECYTEIHHILPRCLGGSDLDDNLVTLTAREHCLAHLLLAKIHNHTGLWAAVNMMTKNHSMTSRAYAIARAKHANSITGTSNPFYGKKHTAQAMANIRNSRLGAHHTKQAKARISQANSGTNNASFISSIQCTDLTTKEVRVFTGKIELIAAGFDPCNVYKCLTGKRRSHKNNTFVRI